MVTILEMAWNPAYTPFVAAITIMLAIAALEGVFTLLGFGFSSILEAMLPDLDLPDADVDLDLHGHGIVGQTLGWVGFGKVPALIGLIVFVTTFGVCGILIQRTVESIFTNPLPSLLAAVPAMLLAIPFTRWTNELIAAIIPKEITTAVCTTTFIGSVAEVTLGTATSELAAEATVIDIHGHTHNIFVKPMNDNESIAKGSVVLLIKQLNVNTFLAQINTNSVLVD